MGNVLEEPITAKEAVANIISNHYEVEGQNYFGDPTRECAECGTYFPCVTNIFASALEGVLGIESLGWTFIRDLSAFNDGYNACLDQVKELIERVVINETMR